MLGLGEWKTWLDNAARQGAQALLLAPASSRIAVPAALVGLAAYRHRPPVVWGAQDAQIAYPAPVASVRRRRNRPEPRRGP